VRDFSPRRTPWLIPAVLALAAVAVGRLAVAQAQPKVDTVVILYTNDLHGRLKPNRTGVGGMAYVSGYVQLVRQERPDVLLLDGGDVCEKGDMLEVFTKGEAMYRAMSTVGYDAGAPGNHDFVYGLDQLLANGKVGGFPLVCANVVKTDTRGPLFDPYVEMDVDGVRVGVIGGTISYGAREGRETLDVPGLAAVMKRYVAELEPRVQLIVAVVHLGSRDGRQLSALVDGLDVIVTGHTHEVLAEPIIAEEGGAIIVQAGQYATHVGRLELKIDMATEAILEHRGRLVELGHDTHAPDEKLASDIATWNKDTCPEADELIGTAPETLASRGGLTPFGEWTAQALRFKSGADVALLDTDIFREKLYAGPVTLDDLFRTLVPGNRREVRLLNVTGAELLTILRHRVQDLDQRDHIVGVAIDVKQTEAGKAVEGSDVDPERTYRVAVPRMSAWPAEDQLGINVQMTETGYTVLDAMVAYARHVKTIVAPTGQ